MPPEARPAFEFAFLLFDLLSVLSLAAQWLVIKNGLQEKQKWAFHYMILIGLVWPIAACTVSVVTGAYSYLVSAGMMTLLFSTPLLVIYKYFK